MDFFKIIFLNSLYGKDKFKVKRKDRFFEFLHGKLIRPKKVKKLWDGLWYGIGFLEMTRFRVSLAFFYEALYCFERGALDAAALLCRASLESAMYQFVKYHASMKVSATLGKKHYLLLGSHNNPNVIKALVKTMKLNPSDSRLEEREMSILLNTLFGSKEKGASLSRLDLIAVGKGLGIINSDDPKIEQYIGEIWEAGDMRAHYDEKYDKMMTSAQKKYDKNEQIDPKDTILFAKYAQLHTNGEKDLMAMLEKTAHVLNYICKHHSHY